MKQFEFWHDHAGVSVPNLEAAIAWYHGVLGFELERRIVIESIPAHVAVMKNGNLRMELFEATGGKAPAEDRSVPDQDVRTWGNKHVSFAVDDVMLVSEELKLRGADIVWIKKLPFGGANIFLRDNSGNLIEFVQRARPTVSHANL
jgi:methylmalonyl-CoA/ethylmalonyl-CoA epimerase